MYGETYTRWIARKKATHANFDDSTLAKGFIRYFNSGERIRVASPTGEWTRTGTVGVTTGWRPAFLLMHRSSDSGSSDVLHSDTVVTHVQRHGKYVPVETVHHA